VFWFLFLFQLLNPISKHFNFFVCASLCGVVSNFTKKKIHSILVVLWLLINFFNMMLILKIALLVYFSQVVLQSHHALFLCYEYELSKSPFPFQSSKRKTHFHVFINFVILHQFKLSSFFEFCLNKDLGD
jgi:hypothetical protein